MNVTFLIPNKTVNPDWIADIISQPANESYEKLTKAASEWGVGITRKIGNGSFRDKVEWNQVMRTAIIPLPVVSKRKGYQLINYDIKP